MQLIYGFYVEQDVCHKHAKHQIKSNKNSLFQVLNLKVLKLFEVRSMKVLKIKCFGNFISLSCLHTTWQTLVYH